MISHHNLAKTHQPAGIMPPRRHPPHGRQAAWATALCGLLLPWLDTIRAVQQQVINLFCGNFCRPGRFTYILAALKKLTPLQTSTLHLSHKHQTESSRRIEQKNRRRCFLSSRFRRDAISAHSKLFLRSSSDPPGASKVSLLRLGFLASGASP
jgi:hypothetical protein